MRRVPKGKVILYTYIRKESKAWLEEQGKSLGGLSKALDLLLIYMRRKKYSIEGRITRKHEIK